MVLPKAVLVREHAHAHAEQEVLYRPLEASQSEASRSFALEGANEPAIAAALTTA